MTGRVFRKIQTISKKRNTTLRWGQLFQILELRFQIDFTDGFGFSGKYEVGSTKSVVRERGLFWEVLGIADFKPVCRQEGWRFQIADTTGFAYLTIYEVGSTKSVGREAELIWECGAIADPIAIGLRFQIDFLTTLACC
jgi:hypothetical protein